VYIYDRKKNLLSSGLGYILGAYATKAFGGDWRWALRVEIHLFIYYQIFRCI
jgi:hypothetical protein